MECCKPCVTLDELNCLAFTGEVIKSVAPGATNELAFTYVNLTTGNTRTQTINTVTGAITGTPPTQTPAAPEYTSAPVIVNTAVGN